MKEEKTKELEVLRREMASLSSDPYQEVSARQVLYLLEYLVEHLIEEEKKMYSSGFRAGDRVILQNLEGRKYNEMIPLEEGTVAVVREKPNVDFPDDAVQIEWRKGVGAVDARCLKKGE